MLEHETKAVVLAKEIIGEADAQVALYTELLGKIDLTAKGLKKITAKLSHHLEPINLVNVSIVTVNHKHLTSALAINNFPNLRRHPLALSIAIRNLKILNESISSPEPDKMLWLEIISFLEDLEELSVTKKDNLMLGRSLYFLSRLARALGVLPDSISDLKEKYSAKAKITLQELLSNKNFKKIEESIFNNNIYNEVEPILKKIIIQAQS